MKSKNLSGVFILLVVFAVGAQQYDDEMDFRVELVDGGRAVEIMMHAGGKQAVNIPSVIGGLPVTSIRNRAFWNDEIISVTIPFGVTSIGMYAFAEWGAGQSINIEGRANQAAADAVWGAGWWEDCGARINYRG